MRLHWLPFVTATVILTVTASVAYCPAVKAGEEAAYWCSAIDNDHSTVYYSDVFHAELKDLKYQEKFQRYVEDHYSNVHILTGWATCHIPNGEDRNRDSEADELRYKDIAKWSALHWNIVKTGWKY